jgi:hypothetical protein
LRRALVLFGHAAAALGELGFVLGTDGVGGAGALLLRAAVLRMLRVALRLTVALLGSALLLPALLGAPSLPVRAR